MQRIVDILKKPVEINIFENHCLASFIVTMSPFKSDRISCKTGKKNHS